MEPTQCIKICNACIKIWSRKPAQYIRIGNACIKVGNRVFSAICDNFRHCETISLNLFLAAPPARKMFTPTAPLY